MSTFSGTHTVEGGIDGLYVIIRDTTTNVEYIANTGHPVSELTFTQAEVEISNPSGTIVGSYSMDGTQVAAAMTGAGLKITSTDIIGVEVMPDDLYNITFTIDIEIDGGGTASRVSASTNVFYGVIHRKLLSTIISTAWKIVYCNKNPYYDNSLKLKSWFDNMKIAQDLGFYSESLRLLKALQKVLV